MIFEDKVVVITGCGSGIGRGLAAGFCGDGAHVVGIGRTEDDLAATASEFGRGRMHYMVGDVSRAEDVARLFDEAESRHGRVDILINNAAVYPRERFLEGELETWIRAIEINVFGTVRCCHRALPGMLERGYGRILNLGSYACKDPFPTTTAYATSKGAVQVLTEGIAREIDRYRHPNVLVNEWLPGIFNTRMTPDAGEDPMTAYEGAKVVAGLGPGGPNGKSFLGDQLVQETPRLKTRIKRRVKRLLRL